MTNPDNPKDHPEVWFSWPVQIGSVWHHKDLPGTLWVVEMADRKGYVVRLICEQSGGDAVWTGTVWEAGNLFYRVLAPDTNP